MLVIAGGIYKHFEVFFGALLPISLSAPSTLSGQNTSKQILAKKCRNVSSAIFAN
jgi:hypothetical protein